MDIHYQQLLPPLHNATQLTCICHVEDIPSISTYTSFNVLVQYTNILHIILFLWLQIRAVGRIPCLH